MDIMGWLFRTSRNRDGQAVALEEPGLGHAPSAPSPGPDPEGRLEAALATRLLDGWLSNRQQVLVPHTLNFRALDGGQGALLVDVMAAAAQADGTVDPREAQGLPQVLGRVGAGAAEQARLASALSEPQNLGALLARVEAEGLATHAYAAALLAVNRRAQVNRAFLDYLAARLGLAADIARSLERRYRA